MIGVMERRGGGGGGDTSSTSSSLDDSRMVAVVVDVTTAGRRGGRPRPRLATAVPSTVSTATAIDSLDWYTDRRRSRSERNGNWFCSTVAAATEGDGCLDRARVVMRCGGSGTFPSSLSSSSLLLMTNVGDGVARRTAATERRVLRRGSMT